MSSRYGTGCTDPFAVGGEWLRCALHAHTTRSDGELEPDALAAHYARAGYDVLAITDHWRRTEAAVDGRLLVIPSVELNCILPGRAGRARARVGIDGTPTPRSAPSTPISSAPADWIEAHGGVAYLAHPYWSGATPGRSSCPRASRGSRSSTPAASSRSGAGSRPCTGTSCSRPGRRCFGIATDDSHHPGFDSDLALDVAARARAERGGGARGAREPARSTAAPGRSLHASSVDGDAVEVRCSPCRSVTLVSGHARARP